MGPNVYIQLYDGKTQYGHWGPKLCDALIVPNLSTTLRGTSQYCKVWVKCKCRDITKVEITLSKTFWDCQLKLGSRKWNSLNAVIH